MRLKQITMIVRSRRMSEKVTKLEVFSLRLSYQLNAKLLELLNLTQIKQFTKNTLPHEKVIHNYCTERS